MVDILIHCCIFFFILPNPTSSSHTTLKGQNKRTKISRLESGLKLYLLKLYQPGQFSLSGQIFLHWQQQLCRGSLNFKIKKSRLLFTNSFKSKCQFQDLRFQSTYRMSSRWCVSIKTLKNQNQKDQIIFPVVWEGSWQIFRFLMR